MNVFREWITADKQNIMNALNNAIFAEAWEKYAKGSVSAWEMEVLCFYYHEHELIDANIGKYGLSDFFDLPEDPVVDRTFWKGDKEIKLFKLNKICGTCIAKDKTKSTVTLLTTTGVVTVKFRKEYFAMFDKQISERYADGTKKIVEKSWFNRGNMILVQGIRSGDNFIPKNIPTIKNNFMSPPPIISFLVISPIGYIKANIPPPHTSPPNKLSFRLIPSPNILNTTAIITPKIISSLCII